MSALLLYCACMAVPPDGVPAAADLNSFPPAEVAEAQLAFAEQHVEWVRGRLAIEGQERFAWRQWLCEAERLRDCWWWLADAHRCDPAGGEDRLGALRELRQALGKADYYAGRMPPPVPLWRFREVR